ncbi:ThiF family adenylyltransferase [Pseudomonas viridiflava]|uniref:ThiF family adenylyltransferase n=1 Tax=Pseudomonas viridiflava TaxID=33069 RepID=UPI0017840D3F|nr:ThiF family adenylyltransferase [Pseudomonas viridiflava]MBD8204786.1 ThiF family adenylyltransferase [Pseudomonas viridiflava]
MSALGDTLRTLRARGFAPVAAKSPVRAFKGVLACKKGDVSVKLTIKDWDFLSYPVICILDRPDFLPELMPHIDVLGNLCYFAPGSVTLDRYDPATALLQCLNQATAILDRIATDPGYRDSDIQNEFPAHWEYGQASPPWEVLMGYTNEKASFAHYFIIEKSGKNRIFISSEREEAETLASSLGGTLKPSSFRCWLLKTPTSPAVPKAMPGTVKELFSWLRTWDKTLSDSVQKILSEPDYLKFKYVSFVIDTPVGRIGFGFNLDPLKRKGYSRIPSSYRQWLHSKGGKTPLIRLSIEQVSSQFVHSRNLHFPDLYNKRVTVVGCGAIGSFVAHAMVRLGAGTGKLGGLKLIDPDRIGPENLGRHILGYPSLFEFKANALAADLSRQFPHSKIEDVTGSVFAHKRLWGSELIIDATGEETVSELLNGLRLQRKSHVPILHVWIRGNGEAVQALWTDDKGGGCYRCLLVPGANAHRQGRYRLLNNSSVRRTDGCRAYTPYAVSAPLHAAALATEMVCDWLQGSPAPRFRTQATANADVSKVKNQNLSKIKGCPACELQ